MAKKDMGDSGTFGPAMKKVPNSLYKNKPAKGKLAMPKVPPVQADTLQSGGIDNAAEISQGLFKGVKLRNVKTKSGMNRMQQ